jgi:hypothetical protein
MALRSHGLGLASVGYDSSGFILRVFMPTFHWSDIPSSVGLEAGVYLASVGAGSGIQVFLLARCWVYTSLVPLIMPISYDQI